MPRHGTPASDFTNDELSAVKVATRALLKASHDAVGTHAAEQRVLALLMEIGRDFVKEKLEELSPKKSFEEDGVVWRIAQRGQKKVMTTFGWVAVERPLFRSKRNGPTRCLVSERAGLFEGKWTARAAKIAALATAEIPFGRAEALFRELGGMAPSKTILQRLDRTLLELWEKDRERNEQRLRAACPIPKAATTAVLSLDGVMVHMVGSDREEKAARTRATGIAAKGPIGYKEASVGLVSFYDSEGARLTTWRMGRMPGRTKEHVRAWLRSELDWIRKKRPDIRIVAAADGQIANWVFLKTLQADVEVVDFFHTVEHVARVIDKANGPFTLDTQAKMTEAKRLLLEEKDGAERLCARLHRLRKRAGTMHRRGYDSYFQAHRERMKYADFQEQNIPIGTGVTEGTCRTLVVDRLRRSGMSWSEPGGQAVMNLRGFVVSERFEAGWRCLVAANQRRHRLCG